MLHKMCYFSYFTLCSEFRVKKTLKENKNISDNGHIHRNENTIH